MPLAPSSIQIASLSGGIRQQSIIRCSRENQSVISQLGQYCGYASPSLLVRSASLPGAYSISSNQANYPRLTKAIKQLGKTFFTCRRYSQIPTRRPAALIHSSFLRASGPSPFPAFASYSPSARYATAKMETSSDATSSVIFSKKQPAELPQRLSRLTAWTITESKMGISRQFTFRNFSDAWRFMSGVADQCEQKDHHPSWSNLYNVVSVEWTTHRPKGLSIKDVEMAEFCDRIADEIGLKV